MVPLIGRVEEFLEEAAKGECPFSGIGRRIIRRLKHLSTFVQDQSVDPTNILPECIVREACRCHLDGIPAPSLIKPAHSLAKSV